MGESDDAEAMSAGDIFLLVLAKLSAIMAVVAASESEWLTVAGFSGLAVSNLVLLTHFRRRKRRSSLQDDR